MEPRPSSPGGDVEHLADLVRIEAQVVMQGEDRPLLGRQPPEPSLTSSRSASAANSSGPAGPSIGSARMEVIQARLRRASA
jgi:hypothetical protein